MKKRYTVVGLTGQTGSGKTTVCEVFREEGFFIIDCDRVARAVTEDGTDCCRELREHFPACIDERLHLDRRALGKEVFADKDKLGLLNSLIFPYINREIERRIKEAAEVGQELILLDAPTLFEAGADRYCDLIVACTADRELRLGRITVRDGLDRRSAEERTDSQQDDGFFRSRADYIIENNGTREEAMTLARRVAEDIKKEQYGKNDKQEKNGGKAQKARRKKAE